MYVQSGTWTQVSGKFLWGCRCGHIRSTMYTTQAVLSEQSAVKPHSAALVDVARNPLVVIWYWIDFVCFTVRSLSIICVDFPSPVLRKILSNWKNRVWNTLTLKSKILVSSISCLLGVGWVVHLLRVPFSLSVSWWWQYFSCQEKIMWDNCRNAWKQNVLKQLLSFSQATPFFIL